MAVRLDGQAGDALQSGQPGGTQAALSGHQLPPALPAADGEGLKHSQLPDGGGQLLQLGLGEGAAGLVGIGLDGVHGEKEHPAGRKEPLFGQRPHRSTTFHLYGTVGPSGFILSLP